jgi:hypothetical protein
MGLVLGSSFAVTDDLLDVESGNAGHLETRGGRTWFIIQIPRAVTCSGRWLHLVTAGCWQNKFGGGIVTWGTQYFTLSAALLQ